MRTTPRTDYHPTLSAVRTEIMERLAAAQAVLADPDFFLDCFKSFSSGVPYSTSFCPPPVRESAPLATHKGKPTRRWAHASVVRTCAGNYELTFYIL